MHESLHEASQNTRECDHARGTFFSATFAQRRPPIPHWRSPLHLGILRSHHRHALQHNTSDPSGMSDDRAWSCQPVMYTRMLLRSSDRRRLERGVLGGRRPVKIRMKFSTVTCGGVKVESSQPMVRHSEIDTALYLIPSVIHLHVIAVHVDLLVDVVENTGWKRIITHQSWVSASRTDHSTQTWPRVSGIASHVIRQHHDDLTVRNAETFNAAVHGEHVGYMTIVEPKTRCVDKDGPVVGVTAVEELFRLLMNGVWNLQKEIIMGIQWNHDSLKSYIVLFGISRSV